MVLREEQQVPSHGRVIDIQHDQQIWKVTLKRKVLPTYTVWMSPQAFVALYQGITLRNFATDYLTGGDDLIRSHLINLPVETYDN